MADVHPNLSISKAQVNRDSRARYNANRIAIYRSHIRLQDALYEDKFRSRYAVSHEVLRFLNLQFQGEQDAE